MEVRRNPRRVKRKKPVLNGIQQVVPDGYYTRAMAAAKVGRSVDTLKRWQETGLYKPKFQMMVGQGLHVWLYSEHDIEAMKEVAAMQRRGRKAKSKPAA